MTTYAPSITAEKGRSFLIKCGSNASPPVYSNVTGLKATNLTINNTAVDVTSKSSAGIRELLDGAGVNSMTITGSGVWDEAGTNLKALQTAALTPSAPILAEIATGGNDTFAGFWQVTQFQRDGQFDGAETFSLTLESTGPIAYTAGP